MRKQNRLLQTLRGCYCRNAESHPSKRLPNSTAIIQATTGGILKMNSSENKIASNSEIQLKLLFGSQWRKRRMLPSYCAADWWGVTNGCRRTLKLPARSDNILTREKVIFIYTNGKNEDKSALITETIILGNSSNNGKQISQFPSAC